MYEFVEGNAGFHVTLSSHHVALPQYVHHWDLNPKYHIWFSPLQIYDVTFMRGAPFGMMLYVIEVLKIHLLWKRGWLE